MKTEKISLLNFVNGQQSYLSSRKVLPCEVPGVDIEYVSAKGEYEITEVAVPDIYNVLLTLAGEAFAEVDGVQYKVGPHYLLRLPHGKPFAIRVNEGCEFHFLQFRKELDVADQLVIQKYNDDHSHLYITAIKDCPQYTEDIKSNKTVNRMILPEGFVPRFCMGSVTTEGPDQVTEHEHPMLDQLFFGLDNCHCTCSADGDKTILSENMMLHIPLGSKHSVSVEPGKTLSYIWFDFFLSLEGELYMKEQHKRKDD